LFKKVSFRIKDMDSRLVKQPLYLKRYLKRAKKIDFLSIINTIMNKKDTIKQETLQTEEDKQDETKERKLSQEMRNQNIKLDATLILLTLSFSVSEFLQLFSEFVKTIDTNSEYKYNLTTLSSMIDMF